MVCVCVCMHLIHSCIYSTIYLDKGKKIRWFATTLSFVFKDQLMAFVQSHDIL